ncbi:MAG TPA: hypothetical protein VFQ54_01420 [Thermomicrobiales bacterium]|nr:hypothetical protein [Thermomicrobiales bacterium]
MVSSTDEIAKRAYTFGIVAGLRSLTPLALLAFRRNQAPDSAGWKNWPVLSSDRGRKILLAAAAGELIMDKLPNTPSRLKPLSLFGRVTLGSIAGAAIGSEAEGGGEVLPGAIAGAAGGLVGSFGGFLVRKVLTKVFRLPDKLVALSEDGVAIAAAAHVTRLD